MAIIFHPRPGQILLCDFSQGFKSPEMVKNKRPVVVLTESIKGRNNLVTVTPLSTVKPEPPQCYHCESLPPQGGSFVKRLQSG